MSKLVIGCLLLVNFWFYSSSLVLDTIQLSKKHRPLALSVGSERRSLSFKDYLSHEFQSKPKMGKPKHDDDLFLCHLCEVAAEVIKDSHKKVNIQVFSYRLCQIVSTEYGPVCSEKLTDFLGTLKNSLNRKTPAKICEFFQVSKCPASTSNSFTSLNKSLLPPHPRLKFLADPIF